MGYWKDRSLELHDGCWDSTDGSVCSGCVNDDALKIILRDQTQADLQCDFCGSIPAAHFDTLLEAFVNGLHNEYENALEGVGWEGREGGFQWQPQWDTWDLVTEFWDVLPSEKLLDAVRTAVHDITWVEKDFITRRRDDVLVEAWDRFCKAVKYKTRFVFWLLPHDRDPGPGEISPAGILDQVGRLIEQLNLVRILPAGYRVWRARTHDNPVIKHVASKLGTAPRKRSLRANRMSPAGIPMFYGSTDANTAIEEVIFESEHAHVTWCQFELTADLAVVDLTQIPAEPSMFDPELGSMRRQIRFLNMFVEQLSGRVKPRHAQIDYVPTQIVTEYLLRVHGGGDRVGGLIYRSSIADGSCLALDVRKRHCIDPETAAAGDSAHLKLVTTSVGSGAIPEVKRSM